jgi:hypothetical protein
LREELLRAALPEKVARSDSVSLGGGQLDYETTAEGDTVEWKGDYTSTVCFFQSRKVIICVFFGEGAQDLLEKPT